MTEKLLLLPVVICAIVWNLFHPVTDANVWKAMQTEYAEKKKGNTY